MADLAGPHSYQYDALYRLTQAQTDSYGYDAVGNRLTKKQRHTSRLRSDVTAGADVCMTTTQPTGREARA